MAVTATRRHLWAWLAAIAAEIAEIAAAAIAAEIAEIAAAAIAAEIAAIAAAHAAQAAHHTHPTLPRNRTWRPLPFELFAALFFSALRASASVGGAAASWLPAVFAFFVSSSSRRSSAGDASSAASAVASSPAAPACRRQPTRKI